MQPVYARYGLASHATRSCTHTLHQHRTRESTRQSMTMAPGLIRPSPPQHLDNHVQKSPLGLVVFVAAYSGDIEPRLDIRESALYLPD